MWHNGYNPFVGVGEKFRLSEIIPIIKQQIKTIDIKARLEEQTMKQHFSNGGAHTTSARRYQLHSGFTLVEILVVLAIIAILAAILLPVFNSARESSKQANCAANLQQIGVAVQQYYQDEKKYPSSLAFLLPQGDKLNDTATTATANINGQACDATAKTCPNPRGTGYLKSPSVVCPDDDTTTTGPRASYGDVSTKLSEGPALAADAGRYVWNYWGYKGTGAEAGFAYTQTEAATDPVGYLPATYVAELTGGTGTTAGTKTDFLRNPAAAYDATNNPVDPRKVPRMANRFAPANTIITHCVYHRVPTSANLAQPQQLYPLAEAGTNAKDVVLRLDGSASTVDVTTWEADANKPWATQRQK